jgi:hypothetical protein
MISKYTCGFLPYWSITVFHIASNACSLSTRPSFALSASQ